MIAVGLDIGTSSIIVTKEVNGAPVATKLRNCFIDIEATPIVKKTLDSLKLSYIEDKERKKVILVGDAALQIANVFSRTVRRTMKDGIISRSDSEAIPMMREILRLLLDMAEVPKDSFIKYTIPADPINSDLSRDYHKAVIEKILNELGYAKVEAINEGLCVIYSQLAKDQYSGIGISLGAGQCNISVAQYGIEAIAYSIVGGGDTIDEKVAQSIGGKLTPSKVTIVKEAGVDVSTPKNSIEEAISIYYRAMLTTCLKFALDKMTNLEALSLKEDISIAVAGGSAQIKGFEKLFKQVLEELSPSYAFTYGKIIVAPEAQMMISAGALEAAKLSQE